MASVLIVEDDLMIADYLEEILVGGGYSVCGVARTVSDAAKLGNSCHPDLMIVDLRLRSEELGTAIVPLLTECDRPGVLYATGNDSIVLTRADGDVCIRKPYLARDMLGALRMVEQIVAGQVPPPRAGARVLA